jgi:probable phosphoglycerate mutase
VRHGESAGNAARDAAEGAGLAEIDLPSRDVDVPLSALGERQAHALATFFRRLRASDAPTVVVTSPYVRARRTALIAMTDARIDARTLLDERLREREFGWVDGLTRRGIAERFPLEAERRARLGKFYHRPPGGESWCDVILRVRSFIDSLSLEHAGERVLLIAHQVVILAFRYVLETMNEEQVLAIDAADPIANCAITSYACHRTAESSGSLVLELFNHTDPLHEVGEPVTRGADAAVATR